VVSGVRPVSAADTATAVSTEPGSELHGALDPYETVPPYSSLHSLTSPPFGFTVAFSVAAVCVTAEAAFVSTVGGLGNVFSVKSPPLLVPPGFVATTRK
jgi:hypothetical protein